MRKLFYLIAASLLVFSCKTGSVKIGTSQGDLLVTPMTDNSVRVQMMGEPTHNVEELIFTVIGCSAYVQLDGLGVRGVDTYAHASFRVYFWILLACLGVGSGYEVFFYLGACVKDSHCKRKYGHYPFHLTIVYVFS